MRSPNYRYLSYVADGKVRHRKYHNTNLLMAAADQLRNLGCLPQAAFRQKRGWGRRLLIGGDE